LTACRSRLFRTLLAAGPRSLLIFLATMFLAVPHAGAHSYLLRAMPPAGSTVPSPPSEVTLWFTQRIEPAFSSVEVSDSGGNRVDHGDAHADPANDKVLIVSLGDLRPGTYNVTWRVLSIDTHATEGRFTFRIGE
jgi:copper resistance protein C